MKKHIHELEKLANDLRRETEKMADGVREGGRQSQEEFEKTLRAAHKLHVFLFSVPDRLMRIAEGLKGPGENGH